MRPVPFSYFQWRLAGVHFSHAVIVVLPSSLKADPQPAWDLPAQAALLGSSETLSLCRVDSPSYKLPPPSCLWAVYFLLEMSPEERLWKEVKFKAELVKKKKKRFRAKRKLRPLVENQWVSNSRAPATLTTCQTSEYWGKQSSLVTGPPPALFPQLQSGLFWREHSSPEKVT